jgi:NAD(P)-dependent dehydrogenase (short-subunit alcohol dehydrogenase family)
VTLKDKTVMVTGGGGPGMGHAIVRMFHNAGARVVAVDINGDNLDALDKGLPDVVTVLADPSTPSGADAAIKAAAAPLDVLCNHAGGTTGPIGVVDETSESDWERTLQVNLTAPFLLSRRVLPGMVERGGGIIINTASVNGLRGARGGPAYAAAKFGVVGLTQHIAATYGSYGIRCNAICPGPTDNPARHLVAAGLSENRPPDRVTSRGRQILSRDRGKPAPCPPEQVASVAFFLATDAAARVNGAIIPVDGGWIAY